MPIIVKDHTWAQSMDTIHIRVPISQAKHEDVDLFTTDSYIKAHFSPFLFEVYLLHDVDVAKSRCIVKEDLIVLDLKKKEEIEWETMEKDLSKAQKMDLKRQVLERTQEEAQKAFEEKRIKKSQLDRFTVQQAMEIDSKQHELMDARRNEQRKKAMDDLEAWKVRNERKSGVTIIELPDDTNADKENSSETNKESESQLVKVLEKVELTEDVNKPADVKGNNTKTIKKATPKKTVVKSEFVTKKKEEEAKRVLPKMRGTAELEITHTPRTFPTPSRESTAVEEETWLKNITLARRATGFVSEDLRPEEQDPQWCKEKGDEFFRNGNYLGAISAYTHGITLSDKLPSLYSNRAATHFALGNFNKCINDCSTALELLQPPCELNRRNRAKCIARRAAAMARIGYLNKAIGEMKAASKLLPEDEAIKQDVYDMERAWEQNPDSD